MSTRSTSPGGSSCALTKATFGYDGDQKRIRKTTPTEETLYFEDLYERLGYEVADTGKESFGLLRQLKTAVDDTRGAATAWLTEPPSRAASATYLLPKFRQMKKPPAATITARSSGNTKRRC